MVAEVTEIADQDHNAERRRSGAAPVVVSLSLTQPEALIAGFTIHHAGPRTSSCRNYGPFSLSESGSPVGPVICGDEQSEQTTSVGMKKQLCTTLLSRTLASLLWSAALRLDGAYSLHILGFVDVKRADLRQRRLTKHQTRAHWKHLRKFSWV